MFEKDNSIPPFSSFELHRQASIARNLVIQACVRAAVCASAKWLRMIFLESTRLARGLAAERRRRSAIRDLQRLDDRMLKDIGVQRGGIEFAARNAVAAAIICFPIGGTMAADCVPLDCARRGSRRRCRDLGASVLHRDGSAEGLQPGAGRGGDQAL